MISLCLCLGSGKTHTIEGGTEEEQGLIPRASQMIFECERMARSCTLVTRGLYVLKCIFYQSHTILYWRQELMTVTDFFPFFPPTDIENFANKSDRFLVRISFLEIYNEKISDLMVCH